MAKLRPMTAFEIRKANMNRQSDFYNMKRIDIFRKMIDSNMPFTLLDGKLFLVKSANDKKATHAAINVFEQDKKAKRFN